MLDVEYGLTRAREEAAALQPYLNPLPRSVARRNAFLLLDDASGRSGPVFKSFRTIVPETVQDCRGNTHLVPDYVPDSTWRSHTDRLHTMLRTDFDRVTLLADVSDIGRMQAAGFDGMAIYDNFVLPHTWRRLAEDNTSRDLLFSFNVNPGFDSVPAPPPPPNPEPNPDPNPDPCYSPPPTEPGSSADWLTEAYRERLAERSRNRIAESFRTTLALQTDPATLAAKGQFELAYTTGAPLPASDVRIHGEVVCMIVFGNTSHAVRAPYFDESFGVAGMFLPKAQVYGCLVALGVLAALYAFLMRRGYSGSVVSGAVAAALGPAGPRFR